MNFSGGFITTKILEKKDRISEVLEYNPRFFRSVNLQNDFNDPLSLKNYILTTFARECLARISSGLTQNSSQRAWRITGDFGTGKSSFALFLAHWFAGNQKHFPKHLTDAISSIERPTLPPKCLPVLVNGSREPLAQALARAIYHSISLTNPEEREILKRCNKIANNPLADSEIIELISLVNKTLIDKNIANGLLIIIDEMGKFLEYAALQPQDQDVLLVQNLAELAARSGATPLFVVGILHQNIHAYTENLSLSVQREWEKVAARYDEIIFEQPFDQITGLVASALAIQEKKLSPRTISESRLALKQTIENGWYGTVSDKSDIFADIHKVYPLHPSVLPVLLRIFHRYAQNERSLFTFLLSSEPMGVRSFAAKQPIGYYYLLPHLYDYIRTNFAHKLESGPQRNHWSQINSIVDSYSANSSPLVINVLKTIGVLNLLNAEDILATDESIAIALQPIANAVKVRETIKNLKTKERCVYLRGQKGGYCLWPHSSVNLDDAYSQASRFYPRIAKVADIVRHHITSHPLVARRHYIMTGNFRFFEVRYLSLQDFRSLSPETCGNKAELLVPLCETLEERAEALNLSRKFKDRQNVLCAIPQTLNLLAGYALEFQRWDWVYTNIKELSNDRFASEEVSKRREAALRELNNFVEEYAGFRKLQNIRFSLLHKGKEVPLRSPRHFLEYISSVFDELYKNSPRIQNELINRVSISTTAASARQRLIDGILEHGDKFLLGMDPDKKPPEMSMYLSVLKASGLHSEIGGAWALQVPRNGKDVFNLHPIFDELMQLIKTKPDDRVSLKDIFDAIKRPPYGVRDGVIPVFLAVFYVLHKHEVAFYEDGTFLRELAKEEFQRLIRKPESFAMQYCRIEGVRSDIFKRMFSVLANYTKSAHNSEQLLDLVRPLCFFCAKLPEYVRETKHLTAHTLAVRDAILKARDPLSLVFTDLPRACDLPPIKTDREENYKKADAFITTLKSAMEELHFAYPKLIDRLSARVFSQFELQDMEFKDARVEICARASKVLVGIVEPKLKSFTLRLADSNLALSQWIESVGSNLALQPPMVWRDSDEEFFYNELGQIASAFRRTESICFSEGGYAQRSIGVRLALTRQDGTERGQVIFLSPSEEKELLKVKETILGIAKTNPKQGIAAIYQALWELLPDNKTNGDKNVR